MGLVCYFVRLVVELNVLLPALVNCGFVTKTEESRIPRVPLRYRYFHATGFVESNLNYYIVSSCISVMFRYIERFSFDFFFLPVLFQHFLRQLTETIMELLVFLKMPVRMR